MTCPLVSTSEHLAIFIPTLLVGGAEKVSVTLANGFASRGYPVSLLTGSGEGPLRQDVDERVEIVSLGGGGVLSMLPGLTRWLRQHRPAAMLSMMTHTNIVANFANTLAGRATRHVASERASLNQELPDLKGRSVRRLCRFVYPFVDHIVTVSEAMKEELVKKFGLRPKQITAIYNPVVNASFHRKVGQKIPIHPWFSDDNLKVIVSVGRLDWQKGFDHLIAAFKIVAAQMPEARLLILGEGAERDLLDRLVGESGISEKIALPGYSDNPYPSMKQADVFVLASRSEGLPGALIQAMACGTPVVSTDCPTGPREILEGGKWGRLVPVGDIASISKAIIEALSAQTHPDVTLRAQDFVEDLALDHYLKVLLPELESTA